MTDSRETPLPVAQTGPSSDVRPPIWGFRLVGLLPLAAMIVALFLPWGHGGGVNEGIADYAAPGPAIVAWALVALGLALALAAAAGMWLARRRLSLSSPLGAGTYLLGLLTWYASAILPSEIASGCSGNGGPLCNTPPASPTVPGSSPAFGFYLGAVGAVILIGLWIAFSQGLWQTEADNP